CFDKIAKVLVARATKLHPTTVGALEHTVPDTTRRGDDVGWIVDAQGARADGRKGAIEQRHFEPLPTPVALACQQRHNDADRSLQGSIVRSDWDGSVDGPVVIRDR